MTRKGKKKDHEIMHGLREEKRARPKEKGAGERFCIKESMKELIQKRESLQISRISVKKPPRGIVLDFTKGGGVEESRRGKP